MSALELLLLEPNLLDAQKVQATLSSGGINYQLLRVDTRADFVEALETNSFDLILSDYSLPGFDGRTALEIARQQRPETPFVFVSASVGEEAAIAALEAGASGFVLKHRLERLVPCLERILRENSRYTSKEAALPEEDESNWAAVAGGRAGATLRDAEARLRAVATNLPQGAVFVVDRDLRYLLAEGKALEEAGTTSEDLVGRTIWEALDPALANYYEPYFRQALNGEPFSHEHYSHDRHYVSHGTPLANDRGEVYAVLAMSYDITDRKHTEDALRKSEEKFRAFVSASSDMSYEMSADWREMRFLGGKDFIATTENPRGDWTDDYIPETDKPRVRAAIDRAIATRSNFELEHRVIRLDGTVGWTFSRAIPLLDEAGEIVKWFGAASDITDRVEAEAALRESEEKYRSLFEAIDEGFCIIELIYDEQGKAVDYRFLEVNRVFEQQTGIENAAGRRIREISPQHEEHWFEVYERIALTGEPMRLENQAAQLGHWYDVYAFRVEDSRLRRVGILFNNITDRKHRERNLAFLANLETELASLASSEEIANVASDRIAAHFNLSHCLLVEIDEQMNVATVFYDHKAADLPSLVGDYVLEDFHTQAEIEQLAAGQPLVINDVLGEPHSEESAARFQALGIRSLVTAPYVREGRWKFALSAQDREPRWWREDEIEFLQELAMRVSLRIERARAEAALRDSEEKFRTFVSTTSDVVYKMSADWREMHSLAGKEFVATTENPREDWTDAYIPETDKQTVWEAIDRAIQTRSIFELEHRVLRLDGSIGWTFSRAIPVLDEQGEIVEWLGAAQDVTERKEAEERMRASEARYRMLFTSLDEAYAVVEPLRNERGEWNDFLFIEVNPAFVEQTGMEYPVGRLATDLLDRPNPRWAQIWGEVAETGEPIRFEESEAELGRTFDLYAFRLDGDRTVGIIFQDITERKRQEQRQAFLLKLTDALRPLSDATEIQRAAMRVLGEHFALDRAMYAEITPDGETTIINDNYLSGRFPPFAGEFPLAAYGSIINKLRDGEPMIVADVDAETELTEAEKTNYKVIGSTAFVTIPLIKGGRWVSNLVVHQGEPRRWTTEEIAVLQETAERTWAAVERARAQEALRESEAKYRSLFDTMDEGYCILKMLYDAKGAPVDFLYVEVNPAFEKQNGLYNATGKTIREMAPDIEPKWAEIYGRVAETGESIRFEESSATLDGRAFDLYAFGVGAPEERKVAVLFTNITDRKRREANTALLDEVSKDLANLSTPDEIVQTVGARVGEFLQLSGCVFVDVDEAQGELIVHHGWTMEGVPSLKQTFRLQDYLTEEFSRACRARETVIVRDTGHDDRTDAENYARLQIGGFIVVPFHWQGRWTGLIAATSVEPRDWRAEEIDLLQEISNRLLPRIERARAEETVAADLQNTQLLRELGARLVTEGDFQILYQEIISAAIAITQAQAGTLQLLDAATNELVMLAWQNIPLEMSEHFRRIDITFNTSCGMALRTGDRSFVDFDVPESEDPHGSLRMHVEAGYLSAQSTPLITRSGRAIGMISTHWRDHYRPTERELRFLDLLTRQAADLIEQRQSEQALRQSESRFRFIVESAKDYAIFTLNLNGIVTSWNAGAQRLLGYAEAEIVGCHNRTIFTPEDAEQGKPDREMHLALTQGLAENERWHVRQDGSRFWGSGLVMPLQDEAGTTQGLVKILQDKTTERQNAAEREQLLQQEQAARSEADRANRIKDEFLAVLSHELRSPLNPILGWTQLLKGGKLNANRQREALETIERNAKLQTQLIDDLLDLSRIMQGKLSLTVAPISLTFVITAAVETVQLAAEAKQIQILLDLTTEIAPISGDAARLQQVIWNLLANAVKFTPKGGRVTVELRQIDRLAQIRVIDTGKGISSDFLPYVFEYFRQADSTTTRKFGGLGLGLAIVKQIVEMHGGTVQVASSGENQGATFTVELPVIEQAVPTPSEPAQPQAENLEYSLSNLQILVVDDEADTREFQSFLLTQSGARVIAVASGLEALQVFDRFIPDVLVSDIGMAQMDGYMLIQNIRSRSPEQGGTIPAIAVTAYARDFDQQKALQSGFQAHITKPVEPDVLIKTITNLLEHNNL